MYLVGAAHARKVDAQRLVESAIANEERLVTDAEVLQEILHRYVAIDRRDVIQPAFDTLLDLTDEVFPVLVQDVDRAKSIVLGRRGLSARDALHVAIMAREGVDRIMTFDTGFDGLPGVTRVGG